jgi:hypothetical protein
VSSQKIGGPARSNDDEFEKLSKKYDT